jgi:hypothetical protein
MRILLKPKQRPQIQEFILLVSAKSDSRAERKILDILEDAEINVGRGADHQLPIRTNWHIVDDLPEENVLMKHGATATNLAVKTV